jgi:hypothetical protein
MFDVAEVDDVLHQHARRCEIPGCGDNIASIDHVDPALSWFFTLAGCRNLYWVHLDFFLYALQPVGDEIDREFYVDGAGDA